MLISPIYKFIFFKSKKCAGSSIQKTLLSHCSAAALSTKGWNQITDKVEYEDRNNVFNDQGEMVQRFHPHTNPDMFFSAIKDRDLYKGYKKITSIRNPWDCALSWYWWTVRDAQKFKSEWCKKSSGTNLIISENDSPSIKRQKFKMWLLSKGNYPTYRNDHEFSVTGSCKYISWINEKFWLSNHIDYFIRFENLQDDFNEVCSQVDIPIRELEKLKTKTRENKGYQEYYDDESRSIVSTHFSESIKKFGYQF